MNTLIKNVDVFDGKNAQLQKKQNILISDHLVRDIVGGVVPEEDFDQVIDAKGQVAIPGLTDAHVHLGRVMNANSNLEYGIVVSVNIAKKLLMHGITTVRDAGGITTGLKQAIDEGLIDGPRIFPSNAYLSQTCGHGDNPYAHEMRDIQYRITTHVALVDGPSEVKRAVREQLYRGASQIKIMAGGGLSSTCDPVETLQFTQEEMKAAVDAAADYGTYVMAHLYTSPCMQRAVKAGVKSLEHAHAMDEETAKMIQDADVFVNPMPQFTQDEVKWNHMGPYSDNPAGEKAKKKNKRGSLDVKGALMEETTRLINKYDLKILFGTDMMITYPEYEPRESLDFTVYKRRFGSYKGIVAATGNFHELVKLTTYQNPYPEGDLGVLRKGSYADIVITKGNPVEDLDILGDVDNILLVMKDGKIFKDILS